VGGSDDGFGEVRSCALSKVLRDGGECHAVLLQSLLVVHIPPGLSKKPRLAVDQDNIEGRRIDACHVYQTLELRPLVVTRAGTGVDNRSNDVPTLVPTVAFDLGDLVGNGDIVLRLPCGGDARIGGNPLGHGCSSPLSLARESNSWAMT